jgi:hypothetical protein
MAISNSSGPNGAADLLALKEQAWKEYGHIDGVQGVGIGDNALRIYVRDSKVSQQIPSQFHGVEVHVEVVGDILAA